MIEIWWSFCLTDENQGNQGLVGIEDITTEHNLEHKMGASPTPRGLFGRFHPDFTWIWVRIFTLVSIQKASKSY